MRARREPVGPLLQRRYDAHRRIDRAERRASDPVAFAHRYADPADQEVAGVLSASLAFGRVAAFRPVLQGVFDDIDAHGGPSVVAEEVPPSLASALAPRFYRWIRGPDLIALIRGLGALRARQGSLEGPWSDGAFREGLTGWVDALRKAVAEREGPYAAWPRGLRYLLPSPATGSACKRWCMFHRWMVRPGREGIDLGLWRRDPASLVMPVDTHVLKLSRFLGLTDRKEASWRTAEDITASLRTIDPTDPVRFDFALAHLGISGACKGRRVAEICADCPLDGACRAPS